MKTAPHVIPTYRWIGQRQAGLITTMVVLGLMAGAYVAVAYLEPARLARQAEASTAQAQQFAAGHAAGFAQAIDELAPTVGDAYALGYRAGNTGACHPNRREAPL
jgi:hypothetical protein